MAGPLASATEIAGPARLFVILNPVAGNYTAAEVRRALSQHFSCNDGTCDVHETTGHENLAELARSAAERGADIVIAAGGDGTVSGVADGLTGLGTPLGIIPLGTTNVLARELGIPVNLEGACRLIAGTHATAAIDAMRSGDRHYYTQIGVGIDALMIRDTKPADKRRLGRLAYLRSALVHLLGFQPQSFRVKVDGREINRRALEVLIANTGTLGQPPFRWGPEIRPDDGRIDVCMARARNLLDYLELFFRFLFGMHRGSPNVRYWVAKQTVTISARTPLPVQADGEIVGETPVDVSIVPRAVRVVVPGPAIGEIA